MLCLFSQPYPRTENYKWPRNRRSTRPGRGDYQKSRPEKCDAWFKGTRAKALSKKYGHKFQAKQKAATPEPASAPVEKAANTVTVEQVKAVAQTVKAIGGFDPLNELLGLIREVGGLRRFKDLLEAMQ